METKRDVGVASAWRGLFGNEYTRFLSSAINSALHTVPIDVKKHGRYLTYLHGHRALQTQTLLEENPVDKSLRLISIYPRFPAHFKSLLFTVKTVEEWSNQVEAVFTGTILDGRNFSFFCQNYLDYKGKTPVNSRLEICISVISLNARILGGGGDKGTPQEGQTFYLYKMRYLNPSHRDQSGPEFCEFFSQAQGFAKITLLNTDIYRIQGVITDDNYVDYDYYIYTHPSLIRNPELLRLGDPVTGIGWTQAEIVGVL